MKKVRCFSRKIGLENLDNELNRPEWKFEYQKEAICFIWYINIKKPEIFHVSDKVHKIALLMISKELSMEPEIACNEKVITRYIQNFD